MLAIGRISVVRFAPFGLVVGLLFVAATIARAAGVQRPNLVFILVDDLRWNTLGCMGDHLVQTPNIDRLAAHGVLFRNSFVATSICCVSRASIFTGQHERRHGIGNSLRSVMKAEPTPVGDGATASYRSA